MLDVGDAAARRVRDEVAPEVVGVGVVAGVGVADVAYHHLADLAAVDREVDGQRRVPIPWFLGLK